MPRGRKMRRRENKIKFRRDVNHVNYRAIPGRVFMRGGDPRF